LAELSEKTLADPKNKDSKAEIVPYSFRSFDRQWAIADPRVGDFLRPSLWQSMSSRQIFLTSLLTDVLGRGPAAVATHLIPDMHHFCNRGGKDVIPLWRDSNGTQPNITAGMLEVLANAYMKPVTAEDLFAYCYSVLSSTAYVDSFYEELETPGPRLPITRNAAQFQDAAEVGKKLIRLHTFGNRFPAIESQVGTVPEGSAKSVKSVGKEYPEDFSYDPDTMSLRVGSGLFRPVSTAVWNFAVSDMRILESWLGYRMKKPTGKRVSPLDKLRPLKWTAQMTRELLEVLWTLEHTLTLQPVLNANLEAIMQGPLFLESDFPQPSTGEREEPVHIHTDSDQQTALFESG
jgi:hypothetical protein